MAWRFSSCYYLRTVTLLLAFVPFLVFLVIERTIGVTVGLVSAAAVAACLLVRDRFQHRLPKVLEIGTFLLFGALAAYSAAAHPAWSDIAVRLRVDAGLLAIVLISILIRRPFTLQYAREQVAIERQDSRDFVRVNYAITTVWACAFAVMVSAEVALLYFPRFSQRIGIIVTVMALISAMKFSSWYPENQYPV